MNKACKRSRRGTCVALPKTDRIVPRSCLTLKGVSMNTARMTWLGAAAILLAGPLSQGQAQYGFYPRYPGYGTPAYQAYVGYARANAAAAVNRAYTWGAYGNPYAYWGAYGNPTLYGGYGPT